VQSLDLCTLDSVWRYDLAVLNLRMTRQPCMRVPSGVCWSIVVSHADKTAGGAGEKDGGGGMALHEGKGYQEARK